MEWLDEQTPLSDGRAGRGLDLLVPVLTDVGQCVI